ncbi:DUF2218 domain-containing protein [Paracoccus zhejiangensis]|uniref:DUF2218 domain-containing protein n=2 Tax=Paracoccus zhejiangensis TaxID=1077935 RepID=A0A2H5EZ96_9RHOB|nr:DUF2218 domain-containing protein [Paracoccus zhejiangensis]
MQGQFRSTGRFSTPNAQKYMVQLCKHFGHKVPAEVEGDAGQVTFGMGLAQMQSDDQALTVVLSGDSGEAVASLQEVIDSHLQRFAFREEFSGMDWSVVAA